MSTILTLSLESDRNRARLTLGLFLLVLACADKPARAARYYLDSAHGNDARSGLSPAEAWRSLVMGFP